MKPPAEGDSPRWRASRRFIAAQASIAAAAADPGDATRSASAAVSRTMAVRIGITVGKRNARRAIDRARAKRVLREAARHAAPALETAAAARRVDVVLRLKSPWPAADAMPLGEVRRALRAEADALLAQLGAHLRAAPPATGAAR